MASVTPFATKADSLPYPSVENLQSYLLLLAISVAAFLFATLAELRFGFSNWLVDTAAASTCGCAWLFMRSLFRVRARSSWPLIAVGVLVASGALALLPGYGIGAETSWFARMSGNIHSLTSSTLLLLALIEPVQGWTRTLPRREKNFRLVVLGCYAGMLAFSVVWLRGLPAESLMAARGDFIRASCALLACALAGVATWWRLGHPLPGEARRAGSDLTLGERIIEALEANDSFQTSDLKVADLAAILGEPEYKISQSITGTLGFRNFNHLVNSLRIAAAKRRLADPKQADLPILHIALDCGFGSIGPFNRAFKEDTGVTPREFRRAALAELDPRTA